MNHRWVTVLALLFLPIAGYSSISANAHDPNKAFLLSVSHGLPGLDFDIGYAAEMLKDSSNQFQVATAMDLEVADTAYQLEKVAQTAGAAGTFAFYYTGHGMKGGIYLQDRLMGIEEIREAIEKGRLNQGPLSRLVLIFDSCNSGSLLDPVRHKPYSSSAEMADEILAVMTAPSRSGRAYGSYWKELIVFASAEADENCLAGESGSMFTVAMKQAWDSVMASDGTIAEFIAQTKSATVGSHPVERIVPASIAGSKLGRTN